VPEFREIVLEPAGRGLRLGVGDLWRYRDLAWLLTWRDLKVRYKQTVLGAAWALLQPLLATAVFTLIFGRYAAIPSEGVPYAVFVYAGLLPWTYVSGAVTNASQSLLANASLVTKVYFPRVVIPASACFAGLVDLAVAATVLAAMVALSGARPTLAGLALLPLLVALLFLLALGLGLWLSALKVEFRDFQYLVPFLIQVWLFLTPVIYPAAIVPGRVRLLLALNPLVGLVEAFRAAALGHRAVSWPLLGTSAAATALILASGLWYFRRVERSFADVI
jgi:lipopolysaccharide transport system permease protein